MKNNINNTSKDNIGIITIVTYTNVDMNICRIYK